MACGPVADIIVCVRFARPTRRRHSEKAIRAVVGARAGVRQVRYLIPFPPIHCVSLAIEKPIKNHCTNITIPPKTSVFETMTATKGIIFRICQIQRPHPGRAFREYCPTHPLPFSGGPCPLQLSSHTRICISNRLRR